MKHNLHKGHCSRLQQLLWRPNWLDKYNTDNNYYMFYISVIYAFVYVVKISYNCIYYVWKYIGILSF